MKLTALVLAASFTGSVNASDHRSSVSTRGHVGLSGSNIATVQTAGLFNLFGSYGTSSRYGGSYRSGYANSGRAGYGNRYLGRSNSNRGGYGQRSGYAGYRPTTYRPRSGGYSPLSGRGQSGYGYGGTGYHNTQRGYGGGYYSR